VRAFAFFSLLAKLRAAVTPSLPFAEDLILAEERTSERDKKRIMEGKVNGRDADGMGRAWVGREWGLMLAAYETFTRLSLDVSARRKAAEGKRKKTEEEEIAGELTTTTTTTTTTQGKISFQRLNLLLLLSRRSLQRVLGVRQNGQNQDP